MNRVFCFLHNNLCNHLCIVLLLVSLLLFSCAAISNAHSGGTDSEGGHWDHSTGEYHYHHGYPAHQHTDGVCPYEAEEPYYTSEDYSSADSTSSSSSNYVAKAENHSFSAWIDVILGFVGPLIFLWIISDSSTPSRSKSTNTIRNTVSTNSNTANKNISTSSYTSIHYCPKCGARMVRRNGRYGAFYGCTNYPRCRGTRSIKY